MQGHKHHDRLNRALLYSLLVLMAIVWAAALVWWLPPWRLFVHADNAIPYLMTTTPWAKEDFYYWGAMRFGAPYPVLWKLIGRALAGNTAAPFYLAFPAFFFLGSAFWMAALPRWPQRAAWLCLLLPFMLLRIDTFLMPGHVYGTVYAFCGVGVYLLLTGRRSTRGDGVALGLVCAVTYWQHLLAGLGLVALTLLKYWCFAPPMPPAANRPWWRQARPFWLAFGLCFGPIELSRHWAAAWDTFLFDHLESWEHFRAAVADFTSRGLEFGLGRTFGLCLLALTLTGLGLAAASLRVDKTPSVSPANRYLQLYVVTSLLSPFVALLLFASHAHYRLNGYHERYFFFVVPFVLLALARLPEVTSGWPARCVSGLALYGLVLLVADRELRLRTGSILDPQAVAELAGREQESSSRLAALLAADCRGYIGGYWQAYQLPAFSDGFFPSSGADNIRNPVYFKHVLAMPGVCIEARWHGAPLLPKDVLADAPERACTTVTGGYWRCP